MSAQIFDQTEATDTTAFSFGLLNLNTSFYHKIESFFSYECTKVQITYLTYQNLNTTRILRRED